jgi:hypothetical protein
MPKSPSPSPSPSPRNISIPDYVKKTCYDRGISLYTNKLKLKQLRTLVNECQASDINKYANQTWKMYGVPPHQERAVALRKRYPKMTKEDALLYTSDPFYMYNNPTYSSASPQPRKPSTYPKGAKHPVWGINKTHFPFPKNLNKKTKVSGASKTSNGSNKKSQALTTVVSKCRSRR